MENNEIFCEECEYLEVHEGIGKYYDCAYPSNTETVIIKNWLKKKKNIVYNQSPQQKNRMNNCKNFKQKNLLF